MNYKKYKEFVINYKPFEWEINSDDFRENIKGKHSFIINFIRFYKVSIFLEKIKQENIKNPKILDVGAFPGNMVMLSKNIFENIKEYSAIGLDLDKKFIEKMKEYNVNCIDTEIDPKFPNAKQIKDWDIEKQPNFIKDMINLYQILSKIYLKYTLLSKVGIYRVNE